MNEKIIGGVVIIYNPHKDILKNIHSYLTQINELLLFDNSNEKKEWLLDSLLPIPKSNTFALKKIWA